MSAWAAVTDGQKLLRASRFAEAQASFEAAVRAEPRLAQASEGLAEALSRQGRAAAAAAEFERLLTFAPQRELARQKLGDYYCAARRYPEAAAQFLTLIAQRPDRTGYYERAAHALECAGAAAQAEAVLLRMLAANPEAPRLALVVGRFLERHHKLEEAEAQYRAALSFDDRDAAAWRSLGDLYARMDADHLAAESYERLVELRPADLAARRRLAGMYLRLTRPTEAERVLVELLADTPGDFEGARMLGLLHLNQDRPRKALPLLAHALSLDGRDARTWFYRSEAYLRVGDLRRREACLRRAVAFDPLLEDAYYALAEVLHRSGRRDELVSLLTGAAAKLQRSEGLHLALALALAGRGDPSGANRVLTRGLSLNPANVLFHYNLGVNFHRMRLYDQAAVHLKRALALDPENAEALNHLACTYLMKAVRGASLTETVRVARKAVSLWRVNADFRDTLGQAYLAAGRMGDAVRELKEALRLGGEKNPVMWEHLGDAYEARGLARPAAEAWRRALALRPDHEELRARLAAASVPAKRKSRRTGKVRG